MKIRQIMAILVAFGVVVVPAVSSASTYQYVANSGNLQTTQENSASAALAVPNINVHSGVILVSNTYIYTSGTYQYVNVNGDIKTVNAVSASSALVTPGIAPHSGVIKVTSSTSI